MVKAEFTEDYDFIRSVIIGNWDDICEDGINKKTYEVPKDCIYIKITNNGDFVGLQLYYKETSISYEIHIIVRRKYRGSFIALKGQAEAWLLMFSSTGCEKINASIPTYRVDVIEYAEKFNMVYEGSNKHSWSKYNSVWDQLRYGITKLEFNDEFLKRQSA